MTELTTAATDALLGGVYLGVLLSLLRTSTAATWKRALWVSVFGLLALASLLGAAAHGLALDELAQSVVWWPLYLALGVAVALFLVGAWHDRRGEAAARTVLPWAVVVGAGFVAVTQLAGGQFFIFVLYESVAMMTALALYVSLAIDGRLIGAGMIVAGIVLSGVAALIQTSNLRLHIVVPFDHNGLFHMAQLVSTVALARGLRQGLARKAAG